eukprot:4470803-Alexandrium_andersonii.AAC.1
MDAARHRLPGTCPHRWRRARPAGRDGGGQAQPPWFRGHGAPRWLAGHCPPWPPGQRPVRWRGHPGARRQ